MTEAIKNQCEGYRRRGGIFTFGSVKWERCQNEGVVLLTVQYVRYAASRPDGKDDVTKALPACNDCWKECKANEEIRILAVEPIE